MGFSLAALLTLALLLTSFALPATAAGSTTYQAACSDVSLRTAAKTSATRKALIAAGTRVRAVATVDGGAYSTTCAGTAVSGARWYRIDAVNGTSVSSLYGVSYVYAATKLFRTTTTYATPPPAGTDSKGAHLMKLVNADRKALGRSTLAIDPGLVAIARNAPFACPSKSSLQLTGRARDMAVRAYFSHDIKGCKKADGSSYRARDILAKLYGYTGSRSEIIHWNSAGTADTSYKVGCSISGTNCTGGTITVPKTVATAQRNFMSSSTHRGVELSTTYDRFGCGSSKAPDSTRIYYACLFTAGGPTVLPKPTPTPTPTPAPSPTPESKLADASCNVNLRTKPSTSATREGTIASGTTVRVIATITSGGSYATECAGRDVAGTSWLKIDRIDGKSASSLYGVSAVYGAARLFRSESSTTAAATETIGSVGQTAADATDESLVDPTPTPDPSPTPTPAPSPTPTATPDPSPTPVPTPTPAPSPTPTPVATPIPSPTPSPTPTPTIAKVYTLGSSVTFYGRGYGHGVGLSQYGARGRAGAGQDYATILAHYFKGATLGSVPNSQIRVLVLDNFAASSTRPLTVYGRSGSFKVDGIDKTFPKDARVRFYPTTNSATGWRLVVTSAGGTTLHRADSPRSIRIRPAQTATRMQLYSKPSSYDRYRGVLRLIASTRVDVVNEITLELYLRGVVPAEMPSHWHTEALKAQAVAARSYAAKRLRPGVST
ncbi:MAG TPA: SpoIID/LytB domain-containing protein, partial [Candidatus Limnocylindrales bacterium]|nr:SpoIID/LytB domain-containing protein [Candidatus Limnocylindrales bacterium]